MVADITVVAIGGHSLLDPALPPSVDNQFAVTARAMSPVVDLIARGERIVLTHGNGPQVGFMQLRSELTKGVVHRVPLDSLVADTQGALGYMIQRALREELRTRGLEGKVATIVTEVEVDPEDHEFEDPTKPIGRFYTQAEAEQLGKEHGWNIREGKRGWRRVVPSPNPKRIVQLETIQHLADDGWTVVCCGGGGIPIVRDEDGHITGLEAVIDKDRVSARLALRLDASRLVITTGADAVYEDWGTEHEKRHPRLTVEEVRALARRDQFPPGSMRPKMEASIFYLNRRPGGQAIICSPPNLVEAVDGTSGTTIIKEES